MENEKIRYIIVSVIKSIIVTVGVILILLFGWYDIFNFRFSLEIILIFVMVLIPFIITLILGKYLLSQKIEKDDRKILVKQMNVLFNDERFKLLLDEYYDYKVSWIFVLDFVLYFVLSMFFEEILFRVLLFDFLLRFNINMIWTYIISAISFGIAHLISTREPLTFLSTGLIGVFLCYIYLVGGLWITLIVHIVWDVTIFVLIFAIIKFMDDNKILKNIKVEW